MNNFTTRAITGGVFIATLIFSSLWSLEIIGLLFLFFTIVGTYEYFNIIQQRDKRAQLSVREHDEESPLELLTELRGVQVEALHPLEARLLGVVVRRHARDLLLGGQQLRQSEQVGVRLLHHRTVSGGVSE